MVALQIISRVLQTQDISIIEDNNLTADYFPGYQEEYKFIMKHYEDYGNVPDKLTFLDTFKEFDIVEVQESENYLVDKIREEYLYYQSVPVMQKMADLLQTDSNAAVEYMRTCMPNLEPNYKIGGVDIIQSANVRYNTFKERKNNPDEWFFTTGFPELDDVMHGIQRTEELLVILGRMNEGKSFILQKMCTHIWEIGFNVGFVSPEMGDLSIGYRFDTLYKNFSNQGLMWSTNNVDETAYEEYVNELKERKNKFIVATPLDFNNEVTVTKLRQFVKQHKLDVLAIDGVSYLTDEKRNRDTTEPKALEHLGHDLWRLTCEMNVPVLVVMQANRGGALSKESEETPNMENARGGDGFNINASKVISIKQNNDGVITLQIKKQRNGAVNKKFSYQWSPDTGEFISLDSTMPTHQENKPAKKKSTRNEDAF